jgi:G3E family GTPase
MLEKEALQATEEPTEEAPDEETPDEETPDEETPDEKTLVVEEQQPLTSEQFSAALTTLVTRAKQAGLRPIQMMASTYIAQGLSMIDGLLGAFDESDQKKKKDQ